MTLHLPREHGAWVQLGFSLVGALLLGRPSAASFALVIAALLAFWAHEPLALVLGHRGDRLKKKAGCTAWYLLFGLGAGALGSMIAAAMWMPPAPRCALHPPIVVGTLLLVLVAARKEKSTAGELVAAVALSSWAVPVAVAGDVAPGIALEAWLAFAAGFALATLAIRAVIQSAKPRKHHPLRIAALVAAPVGAASLFALSELHVIQAAISWAVVPAAIFAIWMGIAPPHPRALKEIGWGMTAATLVSTVALVVGFR